MIASACLGGDVIWKERPVHMLHSSILRSPPNHQTHPQCVYVFQARRHCGLPVLGSWCCNLNIKPQWFPTPPSIYHKARAPFLGENVSSAKRFSAASSLGVSAAKCWSSFLVSTLDKLKEVRIGRQASTSHTTLPIWTSHYHSCQCARQLSV